MSKVLFTPGRQANKVVHSSSENDIRSRLHRISEVLFTPGDASQSCRFPKSTAQIVKGSFEQMTTFVKRTSDIRLSEVLCKPGAEPNKLVKSTSENDTVCHFQKWTAQNFRSRRHSP